MWTFLQLTLPTSPSVYDTSSGTSTDIRGRGFYSLGAGVALLKAGPIFDFNFSAEVHRSFAKEVSNSAYGDTEIIPGWGTSQTIGLGWNRGDYRVGSFLTSSL